MAKKLVFWRPTIIFDPDETNWSRISDVERVFADFFTAHGFEANIYSVWPSNEVVWQLSPLDKLDKIRQDQPPQKGPQEAFKNVMKKASEATTKKGKK